MHNPFFTGVGGVLSADIAVPEHDREVSFYSSVLTTGSSPLWRADLSNNEGMPIIGLGARTPDYESLPLQWMPHVQVADIATSVAHGLELGGTEVMHGKDEDGQSQWAVFVDPAGAAFGLIPVVPDDAMPAGPPNRIGRIAGLSLVAPDVAAACAFYEKVIGWSTVAPAAADGARREMQAPDGTVVAEIWPTSDDTGGIPSVWLLDLPVGDLAESLKQVQAAGGEIVRETSATHAIVRDPVGVHFALQANG